MAAQLSDRYNEIRDRGADVLGIGMGLPQMAAHFRDERDIPFPLLVDRTKQTYRALEMRHGTWWDILGPQNWVRFATQTVQGNRSDRPKQDPKQMGGVVVCDTSGRIHYVRRSEVPADNPELDEIVAAIPT